MLGKLLKHEFRATSRILPVLYGVSALSILLCFLFNRLHIDLLTGTTGIISVISIIAVMILTIVLIISRYYKSMYSNEGYLGGSLPVSNNMMIFSKALVAFVWVVLSILVCTLLMFSFVAIFTDPSDFLKAVGQMIGSYTLARQAILFFLVVGVLESIYFIAGIYFAITLSNTPPFQKMGIGGAVVIYIVYYTVASVASIFFMLLIPLCITMSPEGMRLTFQPMFTSFSEMFHSESTSMMSVPLGLGSFLFEAVMCVVLFWLTALLGKKYASVR